jgi:hypothetical protein
MHLNLQMESVEYSIDMNLIRDDSALSNFQQMFERSSLKKESIHRTICEDAGTRTLVATGPDPPAPGAAAAMLAPRSDRPRLPCFAGAPV